MSGQPTVVSLFSGCGGLAGGFANSGYELVGFLEREPAARATFKANNPHAKCLAHDVTTLTDEDLSRLKADLVGSLDVLIAGPPCQGFSLAGKRDPNDARNILYREVIRYADALRPRAIVIENVRLLLSMKTPEGELVIDCLLRELEEHGYSATRHLVNAQDYGVPQFRDRVLIVAFRSDVRDRHATWRSAAQPTHAATSNADSLFGSTQPIVTFRQATADLEALESGERSASDPLHWAVEHPAHVIKWLQDVPEGMSAHDNPDPAMRPPSGYNTTYKRLRWDEPAATVGTTFGMISASRNVHPRETRSLTVREAARCQSFPDDFVFEGNWGEIRTMIGNAVPPGLSAAWARHLRTFLD